MTTSSRPSLTSATVQSSKFRQPKKAQREDGRLAELDWIEAALEELANYGIAGVRIDVLCERLRVTKGSFYWHFKNRDALLGAMLDHWRRETTLGLIERLDREQTSPQEKARQLLQVPMLGRKSAAAANVELAVRLWARCDENARDALAEVDRLRLRYIAGLMRACGTAEDEVDARAILAYSYIRVAATLVPGEARHLMSQCEDILLAIDPAT